MPTASVSIGSSLYFHLTPGFPPITYSSRGFLFVDVVQQQFPIPPITIPFTIPDFGGIAPALSRTVADVPHILKLRFPQKSCKFVTERER